MIPSATEVHRKLAPLDTAALRRLSELSGVPLSTLQKLRAGHPSGSARKTGIDTVRMFWPHIAAARRVP